MNTNITITGVKEYGVAGLIAANCSALDIRAVLETYGGEATIYTVEDKQSNGGTLVLFDNGRFALCFNGNSVWGDHTSNQYLLDDGGLVVI